MSKRSRGSARPAHRRPGTRPAIDRPARERSAGTLPSQLEVAAEVAEDVVEDRPAEAAAELERTRSHQRHRVAKPGSLLAAKAATEYVYVAMDMRRILVVAAILFGILFVAWLLIVVLRLVPLTFY